MKATKKIANPHIQPSPTSESDKHLLGLFALLYRVDRRNRREEAEKIAHQKKDEGWVVGDAKI